MAGEFKAVKEEIRGLPLTERADKWFGRSSEIDSVGHGYFHCASDDSPLLIYFAKRAWDEASFQFSAKQDKRSQAVRDSAAATDVLSRAKKQPSTKNDQ